ncbi:MAG: hypothetical protein NVSMB52_16080 [Chloroflexota bacterium]
MAQTESPSGIVAVLRQPTPPPLNSLGDYKLGIVLDGLADPGNTGTILRTADAFGVNFVVSTQGSADVYSPKVVRAGMGAHFRLPIYAYATWSHLPTLLSGTTFVGAVSGEGTPIGDYMWPNCCTLIVGSEASGLSDEARDTVTEYVQIPTRPEVESLNAAVAAGILMYDCTNQIGGDQGPRYR